MTSRYSPLYDIARNDLPYRPLRYYAKGRAALTFAGELARLYPAATPVKNFGQLTETSDYLISDVSSLEDADLSTGSRLGVSVVVIGDRKGSKRERVLATSSEKMLYKRYGYRTAYREPVGKIALPPILNSRIVKRLVGLLPTSNLYSPYIVLILTPSTGIFSRYRRRTTIAARLRRVSSRLLNEFRNHPLHDRYCRAVAQMRRIPGVFYLSYSLYVTPKLPLHNTRNEKKRIAFITGHLAVGGVEKVLLNIVSSLPHDRYDISIYTTVHNANEWASQFRKYGRVVDIPKILGHKWPDKAIRRYLQDALIAEDPSLIFITNSTQGYRMLPRVTSNINAYVIDLLHTYGTPGEKDAFLRISSPYKKYLSKRVVISKFLKDYLLHKYKEDPDKVRVVYNSPDRNLLLIDAKKPDNIAKLYAVSYFGRLQPDKSPERLVWIAYELRNFLAQQKQQIVVFGDGSMRYELEALAHSLGILNSVIVFKGVTNHPSEAMAKSQYTLLVSNLEGIPMSILESMAVGTPVISTAVGGVPEIITPHRDGILVHIDNRSEEEAIKEIAAAIKQALLLDSREYNHLAHQARKKIDKQFSGMDEEYEKLIAELT